MDELQEVPDPFDPEQIGRIQSSWKERWEGVIQAQNQVLNWLFAVQGGGLAGTLTYASSKPATCGTRLAMLGFAIGLVLIVVYGAVYYYTERAFFRAFRRDALEFYSRKIKWTEFAAREAKRPDHYVLCELLAWGSGIFGALGLAALGFTILASKG